MADNTDTYAFVSPRQARHGHPGGELIPLEEPAGGPNFHNFGDDVKYTLNVDNDGSDAVDDIVGVPLHHQGPERQHLPVQHRSDSLTDPDFNIRQDELGGQGRERPPHGPRLAARAAGQHRPALDAQLRAAGLGGREGPVRRQQGVRRSPRRPVLRRPGLGVRPGRAAALQRRPPDPPGHRGRVDGVSGYNTHSVVLQVPIKQLTGDKNALTGADDPDSVIGVYAASWRRQTKVLSASGNDPLSRNWVQVSRLGMPLVNEVVIPLAKKDRFNASQPADDAQFGKFVLDPEVARLIPVPYPGSRCRRRPATTSPASS